MPVKDCIDASNLNLLFKIVSKHNNMNSKSYLYLYLEVIKVMSCEPFLFFRYNEINYNLKHTAKPESRALIQYRVPIWSRCVRTRHQARPVTRPHAADLLVPPGQHGHQLRTDHLW